MDLSKPCCATYVTSVWRGTDAGNYSRVPDQKSSAFAYLLFSCVCAVCDDMRFVFQLCFFHWMLAHGAIPDPRTQFTVDGGICGVDYTADVPAVD